METQILGKSAKMEARTGPEGSWETPKSRGTAKKSCDTAEVKKKRPVVRNWPPNGSAFGGPFSTFSEIFGYVFAICFRDSVSVATSIDFGWILVGFWHPFWKVFGIVFRIVEK